MEAPTRTGSFCRSSVSHHVKRRHIGLSCLNAPIQTGMVAGFLLCPPMLRIAQGRSTCVLVYSLACAGAPTVLLRSWLRV
jgi:hypothetical protein